MASEATPIEVWLEWRQRPRAAVVVSYARAQEPTPVEYRVYIKRQGASGAVQVDQTGELVLGRQTAKVLSQVLISRDPGDKCSVLVVVVEPGKNPVERNFDCPRPL